MQEQKTRRTQSDDSNTSAPAATPKGKDTKAPAKKMSLQHRWQAIQKWVGANKLKTAIGATGTALVVVTVVLVAVLLPTAEAIADSVASNTAPDIASMAASGAESVVAFDPAKYVGTVLPETEHAGLSYAEETLFLGDSNTVRMMSYYDVTGVTLKNGFGIVGMGIGTFTTQQVAQFEGLTGMKTMPEIVEILQPRRVVLTFGSNNVGMFVDRFIGHYKTALGAVKKAYPHTDIIIGSIFPVDQYRQNTNITMANIEKMNDALADLAKQEDVKFLNWSEAIYDEEIGHSLFEATLQDGVHLTRFGMEAIFDYFCTHSYITEDTRPKPLKAIPKRIGVQPSLITKDPAKVPGPIDWSKYDDSEDQGQMVNVVFAAWDSTNGTSGGGSVSAGALQAAPGGTTASVTAYPADGYQFAGWGFSTGASGNAGSATTSVYIDPSVAPGSTITVTAHFQKIVQTPTSTPTSTSGGSTPGGSETGGDGGNGSGDGGTGGEGGTGGTEGGNGGEGGTGGTEGGNGGEGGTGGTEGGNGGEGGTGGTEGGNGGEGGTGGDGGNGGDGGTGGGDGGTGGEGAG